MKVDTANFGELNVKEEMTITFPEGILGFEELRQFAILETDMNTLLWLQSIENPNIAFPIICPFLLQEDYAFELDDEVLTKMDITSEEDVMVYSIVTIPEKIKDMTANLLAPLVVNNKNRLGQQIVLRDERYPLKHKILREGL